MYRQSPITRLKYEKSFLIYEWTLFEPHNPKIFANFSMTATQVCSTVYVFLTLMIKYIQYTKPKQYQHRKETNETRNSKSFVSQVKL